MNKRKTFMILIAAVLVFTMGVTAAAAGISKISTLGSYFEGHKQRSNIPDEVPIMQNPEDYANEVTTAVTTTSQSEDVKGVVDAAGAIDTYTPPAPGEAKILAVSATKHNMYMTVEINVAGLDIPKELPEDSSPTGQYYFDYADMESNFRFAFPQMELISYENDIMTYGFWFKYVPFLTDKDELTEDEFVLKLKTLGYTAYSDPAPEGGYYTKDFKAVKDLEVEIRLPLDEINIMEAIQSTNTGKLMDADFSMELSPYDLSVYSSFDSLAAAGFKVDNEGMKETTHKLVEYFWREAVVEYHMLDGTSFAEDFPKFTHNLVNGGGIFADTDNQVSGARYSFEVPLDIAKIDYIMINDVRFDFAH